MSRIHPVFPIVKLLPSIPDPIEGRRSAPPPPPVVVGEEEHYKVEAILDSRVRYGKLEFLVRWKGYGYEENSWTVEADVNAPRLIAKFYREHPGAPRRIRALHFDQLKFRNTRPAIDFTHRDAASWRGGDVRGTPKTSPHAPIHLASSSDHHHSIRTP